MLFLSAIVKDELTQVVDDDGLHGVKQVCGAITLKAGDHVIKNVGYAPPPHMTIYM